jgi:hypothetical protein
MKRLLAAIGGLGAVAGLAVIPAAHAAAAHTYYVALGGTAATCAANTQATPFPTIQAAIGCAVAGDTISLAATGTGTYPGIGTISASITVTGAGARSVTIDASSAPLTVAAGAAVKVTGVTLSGENASVTPVVTSHGTLTLTKDTVTQALFGGGIYNAPAAATDSLTINDSTVSGNFNGEDGGGIESIAPLGGTLVVENSTISGNTATFLGGGLFAHGGSVSIVNSTVAGNSVQSGGLGGGITAEGPTTTFTLSNTIVAGNTAPGGASTYQDCYGEAAAFADGPGGHNLIAAAGCSGLVAGVNGDQVDVPQPGLLPLGNYGGPTDTVALQADSPAIGAGSAATCGSGAIGNADQRGDARNTAGRGTCDIGAYDTAGKAAPGHTYYVAPGGTDTSGSCTANAKANAFPQVTAALACTTNGDAVSVAAGTSYSGIGTVTANITIAGAGARTTQVGAGAAPLTVAAGANVTVSGLTLAATNTSTALTTTPIVTDNGALTLTRDTITGDLLASGILVRETTAEGSVLALNGSTVSGNIGGSDGGGIEALGSAIGPLQVSLVNSTVSGNTAEFLGGGLYLSDLAAPPALVTLVNSTISGNSVQSGGLGGGITARGVAVSLSNTILAGNTAPGSASTYQDCDARGGSLADGPGGHNLIGVIAGCTGLVAGVNGDKTGAPGLAALASNGGPTNTMALQAGSPAIAAANPATCAQPPVSNADQRGGTRSASTRGTCDIGAFDTGGVAVAGAMTPTQGSTTGGTTVTMTGSGFTKVTKVLFGSVAGTKVHVVSPTRLTVTTPRHAKGTVKIRIVNAYGESAASTDAFTFH